MISVTCALITAAVRPGMAQVPVDPDLLRCANWTPVGDKPRTSRYLYAIYAPVSDKRKMLGEIQTPEGRRHGSFDFRRDDILAILSNPNHESLGNSLSEKWASVRFTLLLHQEVRFDPDDERRPSVWVSEGYLDLPKTFLIDFRRSPFITCITSPTGMLEEKKLSDFAAGDASKKAPDVKPDAGKRPQTLTVLADEASKMTPNAGVDPGKDTKPPALKPPAAIAAVCSIGTLQPISFAASIMPKSLQAVGIRNNDAEAEEFDYHPYPEDAAVSLGSTFALTNSQGKLVPYEAVARDGTDLWVSLPGVEEPRVNPRGAAVKPDSLLRIIVVGGPAEVAMSGLAEVGAELKKLSAGRVRLSIEWHIVDKSGAIGGVVGRYNSFDMMAKAAAEKAAGGSPDLLNEEHLHRLLDDFENRLKARSEPVEKVFWIKGAYSIPSSIPLHFEKFIKTVSSSEAIAGGTGRSSKWFVLVTARMTGFSINYLKEPIYSLQIGDLIEEGDAAMSEPRRFIRDNDTALLATRLQLAAAPMPTQMPGTVTGKLVLKAADVFEQRGYLLSQGSIRGLRNHLKFVANKWDEASSRENLTSWAAAKTRKPSPTVVDLLQSADDGASQLRLPRMILPDSARKAIRDLTQDEAGSARTFIEEYMDGVDRAAANVAGTGDHCRLFYVPEAWFGFGSKP
jgi:hypothetical protein